MIKIVLSSKLLSLVKTAYWIDFAHENDRVEVKINNIWRKIYEFLCFCKIVFKNTCLPTYKFKVFFIIKW